VTTLHSLRVVAAAAIAAYAAHLAVQHATPIDAALPLVAAIVTLVAALSYRWLMIGVPLLVFAEIALPDEGLRLLAFGAVVAGVFVAALLPHGGVPRAAPLPNPLPPPGERGLTPRSARPLSPLPRRGERGLTPRSARPLSPLPRRGERVRERGGSWDTSGRSAALALLAIVLLRWLPLSDVRVGRELFLLVIAALLVLVLDGTPFATAVAVLVVLITPAIPLRTLILPVGVLLLAVAGKVMGMRRVTAAWPSTIAIGFVLLFFPSSGIVARALPYFLHRAQPDKPRFAVMQALAANKTLTMDVPADAHSLIVSGANVARMERGTILGTIEPGGRKVRVGDAADWGFLRRETFYGTRNPLPDDPAGKVRGYGYAAWVDGAGRVPLPAGAATIRVTGDAALPAGASLQVEGFE
jgi:hypothetical protein